MPIRYIFARNLKATMYSIKINFEQKEMESVVLNNVPAGDSLLEVLLDNHIELHHNCGAVCACSTCHLYVIKGEEHIAELNDKEEDFIDRIAKDTSTKRINISHENDSHSDIIT